MTGDDGIPAVEIPQLHGSRGGQHSPLEALLHRKLPTPECVNRAPQRGRCHRPSLGNERRETVQQEIRWTSARRPRGGGRGARHVYQVTSARQTACKQRRAPRVEVRLPCEVRVQRREPRRRLQQLCSGLAPRSGGRRDLPSQEVRSGALEVVERARFGCCQRYSSRLEGAGRQVRLRRGESALGALFWLSSERNGALQKGGCRSEPATRLHADS